MYVTIETEEIKVVSDEPIYIQNKWVHKGETIELDNPVKLQIKSVSTVNLGEDKEDDSL
jgi:hypothetical protein